MVQSARKDKEHEFACQMMVEGFSCLNMYYPEVIKEYDSSAQEKLEQELRRWQFALSEMKENQKIQDRIQQEILEGKSLKDTFGLSNEFISMVYSVAKHLFRGHMPHEAMSIFFLLADLVPNVAEFWQGIAVCLLASKNYDRALIYFEKAYTLGAKEDFFLISFLQALVHQKKKERAREIAILLQGKAGITDRQEVAELIQQAMH